MEIEADFSFLRDENVIEPVTNSRGVKRYHIEYELVLVADGRNMKALICFPRGTESCYGYENLNLAFAYSPGTA